MLFWPRSTPNGWLLQLDGIRHRNSEREELTRTSWDQGENLEGDASQCRPLLRFGQGIKRLVWIMHCLNPIETLGFVKTGTQRYPDDSEVPIRSSLFSDWQKTQSIG